MKCNFCASGCEPRYKTITQSVIELQEIVDRFDPDYITFVDNLFTRNKKYTLELCESFMSNGFRFEFSATSRADLVDAELLAAMRRAGCRAIFYGLECANNYILRFMKKGITVEQMIEAIDMTKRAGIYPMVSIMFGQPGETLHDFFNSLRIALMCVDPDDPVPITASVMPLLTFPGTGMYRYAKGRGYFSNDAEYWSKYGGSFQIPYNLDGYTNEEVGEVVDIVSVIYRWTYHQSMANKLLATLRKLRSSRSDSFGALPSSHEVHLHRFLDRCLDELVSTESC